jgi:hypothetical protein
MAGRRCCNLRTRSRAKQTFASPRTKTRVSTRFSLDVERIARYTARQEHFVMKRVSLQNQLPICGAAMRKTWLAHANACTVAGEETATKG